MTYFTKLGETLSDKVDLPVVALVKKVFGPGTEIVTDDGFEGFEKNPTLPKDVNVLPKDSYTDNCSPLFGLDNK